MFRSKSADRLTPSSVKKIRTTTIRMPEPVYEFAQEVLESEEAGATTLNELIVSSLEARLKDIQEARIDAGFSQLAHDETYQGVARRLYKLYEDNASENVPRKVPVPSEGPRVHFANAGAVKSHNE